MGNELVTDNNYDYEEVTYSNKIIMNQDIIQREKNGWEVVSQNVLGSNISGGCVGCIGFIPIFFPIGGKKKYIITYRKIRNS